MRPSNLICWKKSTEMHATDTSQYFSLNINHLQYNISQTPQQKLYLLSHFMEEYFDNMTVKEARNKNLHNAMNYTLGNSTLVHTIFMIRQDVSCSIL